MRRTYIFLLFSLCILIYSIFAILSINELAIGDASFYVVGSKIFNNRSLETSFNRFIFLATSPLYGHLLALIDRFFFLNHITARVIGILSFVVTLILIYAIILKISKDQENRHFIGFLGIFLYSINPMVIQGSLLTDIDTTILVPFLLGFVYCFIVLNENNSKDKYFILGVIFAFNLWAKLTTPFALILTIFIFYFLNGKLREGIKASGSIFLSGLSLFIISLFIYCYFTKREFLAPFLHIKDSFYGTSPLLLSSSPTSIVLNIARILLRIILFSTPFYFLIYILSSWERLREIVLRRKVQYIDFLLILSFIILFAYLFVGGIAFSFPKYHYPFLSLAAIINAFFIGKKLKFDKSGLLLYATIAIIIAAYNIFFVEDLLYLSDYALRESLIITGKITNGLVKQILLNSLLYILPFLIVLLILKIMKYSALIYKAIFIWTVSACFSLNILQAKADYHTIYCYGGRGTNEATLFLKRISKETDRILTTEDISRNIDEKRYLINPHYWLLNNYCLDPEEFISFIADKRPECIVFSISSNTVQQYRRVFLNPKVISFLEKNFIKKTIGSYTIWLRNKYSNFKK